MIVGKAGHFSFLEPLLHIVSMSRECHADNPFLCVLNTKFTMDEGPPVTRPLMMGGEQAPPQQQQPGNSTAMGATYSVPGVLHFIKNEFVRFEKERANWEVERAELQVSPLLSLLVYIMLVY